jgi:hypothetical protein
MNCFSATTHAYDSQFSTSSLKAKKPRQSMDWPGLFLICLSHHALAV